MYIARITMFTIWLSQKKEFHKLRKLFHNKYQGVYVRKLLVALKVRKNKSHAILYEPQERKCTVNPGKTQISLRVRSVRSKSQLWSGSALFAQAYLFHTLKGVYWETNSVDADQTLGKAASDVSLHCLPNQVCLNA